MKLGSKSVKGVMAVLLVGLLLPLAATGCDEDVNTTLVTGMNEAAVTAASALINSAFEMFAPDTEPYNNNTGGGDTDTDTGTTI